MRTRLLWLTALVLAFMGLSPVYAQDIINLLTNPGLEDGTANGWGGYGDNTREVVQSLGGAAVPEDPIEGNYCMHVIVGSGAANFWESGLTLWGGNVFEQGKQYTFSVWLKSMEGDREINFKPEQTGTWTAFGETRITMTEEWAEYFTTTPVVDADVPNVQISIHVGFGPGEFWMDAARLYVGEYVETVFGPQVTSENPVPADGAVDVPSETGLGWVPSATAGTHNVYFGDTFADVNSADTASPLLVSPAQAGNTLGLDRVLEFDKVYYWRVDDINATPDKTVFKGKVWSFTTEPYTYPLQNVTATASSSSAAKGMTPDKTVDGSGLTGDAHSTEEADMWLSAPLMTLPAWIQYEFDDVYTLSELWVWNSNQAIESFIGFGARDVTVEHSLDGVEWNSLGDVEFAQAPGEVGYTPNTTVDLVGVQAKFVRLTIASNWRSIVPQVGLSEVRFYYVPVKARQPSPASGDRGVPLDAVLTWRSGRRMRLLRRSMRSMTPVTPAAVTV